MQCRLWLRVLLYFIIYYLKHFCIFIRDFRTNKVILLFQEEQNRGKPNWEHLNEELHVLISVEDTENRAKIKMQRAIEEVKKLIIPVSVFGEQWKCQIRVYYCRLERLFSTCNCLSRRDVIENEVKSCDDV